MTAEEYIKAYTRGCSNELVYGGYHEWLTPENALAAVELAREEMKKDAIDTVVVESYGVDKVDGKWENVILPKIQIESDKLSIGDKVKVIIVKD